MTDTHGLEFGAEQLSLLAGQFSKQGSNETLYARRIHEDWTLYTC